MYAIYGNIYHQYTPNVSIYTSTMDPMGIWLVLSYLSYLHQTDADLYSMTMTVRPQLIPFG